MAKIDVKTITKLREETGAPVIRVKKVLDEVAGDEKKALEILRKEGFEKVAKRQDRATDKGCIATYTHHTGNIAVIVELLCETDFVARNELFQQLGKDVAMQISFSSPKDTEELIAQEFIKDPSKTIQDLIKEVIAKTGENVRLGRFYRLEIGK
jgi:elongation factor Ts